jgi:hypothetical protein
MTGLIRRGARYAIRRIVPVDLREHLGVREIVRTLGTSDPKEAKRLHALAWVQFDREFDQAREQLAGTAIPEPTLRTGPQTISDAEFNWTIEQQAFQDQQAAEDAEAEEAELELAPMEQQIRQRLDDPKADLGPKEMAMRNMLNAEQFKRQLAEDRLAYSKATPLPDKRPKKGHGLGGLCQRNGTFAAGRVLSGRHASPPQAAQPIPLLRQLARGDPPGGDDVREIPFVAAQRGGSPPRAGHRHLP